MNRLSLICMRRNLGLIILLLLLGGEMYADERNLFNDAWRFHRGDTLNAMQSSFIAETNSPFSILHSQKERAS